MKIINIKTYMELKELFTKCNDTFIFRGQSDSEWEINSTLFRNCFITKKVNGEEKMLAELDKSIHLYEKNRKTPTGKIEKLAYLQHHGAPTRLIDFTYSPYVATYFAIKDSKEKCSVFAIDYNALVAANTRNVEVLKREYFKKIELLLGKERAEKISNPTMSSLFMGNGLRGLEDEKRKKADELLERYFYYCKISRLLNTSKSTKTDDEQNYSFLFDTSEICNVIVKVDPYYQNIRRISQSGCFLSQNNIDISFNDLIKPFSAHLKTGFMKIVIPQKLRNEILVDLKKMNISESSIFPDLDGFVRSLGITAEI